MNALAYIYPGDTAARLAVVVFVQIAVIVAAAAVLARVATNLGLGAAARHGVWACALVAVLLAPMFAVVAERSGVALWRWPASRPAVAIPAAPRVAPEADVEPIPSPSRPEPPPAVVAAPVAEAPRLESQPPPPEFRRVLGGALALGWGLGTLALLIRLARGARSLALLRRAARPIDRDRLAAVLDDVRDALGRSALPPIAEVPGLAGPLAGGVLRPVVLLPSGLAESLEPRALRDVLIHECAHVARRDPVVGLLQRLAEAAFWPHPLVHHLNRKLARAREEVCDNFVLRAGDARSYSQTLLRLSLGTREGLALGLWESGWNLEERVAGLLDPGRSLMTALNRRLLGVAVFLLAAAGLAAASVRFDEPAAKPAEKPVEGDVSKARIEGIVVDEDGKPVAGARITSPYPNGTSGVTSGPGGRFTLTLDTASAGYAGVIASADDGARQGIYRAPGYGPDPVPPARIVLKPSRDATVIIKDGQGRPVAGATVLAIGSPIRTVAEATTDADGRARLRTPADANVESVFAFKPGAGADYYVDPRGRPTGETRPPLPPEIALTFEGARSIRVRVVDTQGRPLQGAEVGPWLISKPGKAYLANLSGCTATRATTDAAGIARFDWFPRDLSEHVILSLGPWQKYTEVDRVVYNPEEAGNDAEVKMVARRDGRIAGKVTLPDGSPAPGVLLQIEGHSGFRGYARIAADGTYSSPVWPDHSYMIGVVDNRWAAPTLSGIVIREGERRAGLDLGLGPGTVVRGRVTIGPESKPAAGKVLRLTQDGRAVAEPAPAPRAPNAGRPLIQNPDREHLVRHATADADGRYEFRVGPGDYRLGLDSEREMPALTVRDEPTLTRDFHVEREARVPVHGLVVDEAGRPVAGALVTSAVRAAGNHAGLDAVADARGRIEAERWADPMLVLARSPDGDRAGFATLGPDDREFRVTIKPALALRGRVVDDTGRPRAGLRVVVAENDRPLADDPQARGAAPARIRTDAEGRYTFRGIIPGATVHVAALNNGRLAVSEPRNFEVKPDASGVIDVPDIVLNP